jgi:hypothetical protein
MKSSDDDDEKEDDSHAILRPGGCQKNVRFARMFDIDESRRLHCYDGMPTMAFVSTMPEFHRQSYSSEFSL